MSACSLARPSASRIARSSSSLPPHWLQKRRAQVVLAAAAACSGRSACGWAWPRREPLVPSMIFRSRMTNASSNVTEQKACRRSFSLLSSMSLIRTSVMTTSVLLLTVAHFQSQLRTTQTRPAASALPCAGKRPVLSSTRLGPSCGQGEDRAAAAAHPRPRGAAAPASGVRDRRPGTAVRPAPPGGCARHRPRAVHVARPQCLAGRASPSTGGPVRVKRLKTLARRQPLRRTRQHQIQGPAHRQRLDDLAAAGTPGGRAVEEERHVAAQLRPPASARVPASSPERHRRNQPRERGRRVGRAAGQAGLHRDALSASAPRRRERCRTASGAVRPPGRRGCPGRSDQPRGSHVRRRPRRRSLRELEGVVQADGDHERRQVVVAVGPTAEHLEEQVDLGRRPHVTHGLDGGSTWW